MYNLYRSALFVVVALLSIPSIMKGVCSGGSTSRISVVYVNGILNTFSDADDSRQALEEAVNAVVDGGNLPIEKGCILWFLAYNPTAGFFNDLAESSGQLAITDTTMWKIVFGLVALPQSIDILGMLQRFLAQELEPQVVNQITDLATNNLNAGRLLFVGHSQGNLFVNRVYEKLSASEQMKTAVIAVATPADHVAGTGPYTTLNNDIVTVAPGHLASFLDNHPPCSSSLSGRFACHSFLDSYLFGDTSGPRILGEVIAAIPKQPTPTCSLSANPATISQGQSATLTWTTTGNPTSANINNGIGLVSPPGSGSVNVSPVVSTTYTLTVTSAVSSGTCVASITVNQPPPNQPPTAGFLMTSGSQSATNGQTLNLTSPSGGSVPVSFDGSYPTYSKDDGSVTGWQWKMGTAVVASTPTFSQSFPVGTYNISLVVTDNQGATSQQALGVVVVSTSTPPCPATFTDDFNRPDGSVGNGWSNTIGNVNGNLLIRSGALSTPGPGGRAGIYQPIDLSQSVTVSAIFTQENGFGGTLNRYDADVRFGSDGSLSSGYGVSFIRGDQNYADSSVRLILNGVQLASVPSSFQFGASIAVTVTLNQNRSITGSVTGSGSTFNFSFGLRSVVFPGSNLTINLGFPDGRSSTITNPTVDNLSVTYVCGISSNNLSLAISPTGVIPAFNIACSGADDGTYYLSSADHVLSSDNVLQRRQCSGGVMSFSSFNLGAYLTSSGGAYPIWLQYWHPPLYVGVKKTTSNAMGCAYPVLCNLNGAWNGYNHVVYYLDDTTFPTMAAGPQFTFNGSVWSNAANGDGSVNRP